MKTKLYCLLLISLFQLSSLNCAWASDKVIAPTNIQVNINGPWLVASQGADETFQQIKVVITARKFFGDDLKLEVSDFYQIDNDQEKEYIVISRSPGTGPYYKIQIIDFKPNGILTWSYDSSGIPKIEGKNISLGSLPHGYRGAATEYEYHKYLFTEAGLIKNNK